MNSFERRVNIAGTITDGQVKSSRTQEEILHAVRAVLTTPTDIAPELGRIRISQFSQLNGYHNDYEMRYYAENFGRLFFPKTSPVDEDADVPTGQEWIYENWPFRLEYTGAPQKNWQRWMLVKYHTKSDDDFFENSTKNREVLVHGWAQSSLADLTQDPARYWGNMSWHDPPATENEVGPENRQIKTKLKTNPGRSTCEVASRFLSEVARHRARDKGIYIATDG